VRPARRYSIGLVAAAVLLAVAGPAMANVLGHRAGWDSTVKFNKVSLTTQANTQFNNLISDSISPTDITPVITINQPVANWEVNVFDANYGDTGWVGAWICVVWGGLTTCTQGSVYINLTYGPYPNGEMKSIICEEVGHSVGLAHSGEVNASCMSQQPDQTKLSTHDKAHLNAIY
jgi:hypothetical protein